MPEKFQEEYTKQLTELRELVEKKDADPLAKEKIDKINESLNTLEKSNTELVASLAKKEAEAEEFKTTLDEMEKALNNPDAGKSKGTIDLEKKHFELLVKKGEKDLSPEAFKYLRTDDNENGGYLVPNGFLNEIIKNMVEITPFRKFARVIPTTKKAVDVNKRTTEPTAYWTGEGESTTETQSKYGSEELPTHKLTAEIHITDEMLGDAAFNMESEINSDAAEQFAKAEGTAFITGNSVKKPEGILTNSSVGAYASGIADALAGDPFFEIQGEFKTGYVMDSRLRWMFNAKTLWQHIRTLKDGTGQYLLQTGLKLGVPNMVAGRQYIIAPDMPDVAAGTYPVALGDWRAGYYILDRKTMTMIRDPYTQASAGKVVFYFKRRVGGQVVKAEAIKKMKVATTV